MKKALFWISTVAIFICLGFALYFKPSFDRHPSFNPDTERNNSVEEEHVRQVLDQVTREYYEKNHRLLEQFRQRLPQLGDRHFQEAEANIPKVVKHFSSVTFCGKLCGAMAMDKIRHTDTAMEMISPIIVSQMIVPCEEGSKEIQNALNEFLLQLQENATEYRAGILEMLDGTEFSLKDFSARKEFLKQNDTLAVQIMKFAFDKTFSMVGAGMEALFLRSTYVAVTRLVAGIVAKLSTTAAVSGTAVVADGPLPIGDVIAGGVAIGGLAWTGYDVYQVTKVMPKEMKGYLRGMISDYRRSLHQEALQRAEECLKFCEEGSEEFLLSPRNADLSK